jgi:hypothetical protein
MSQILESMQQLRSRRGSSPERLVLGSLAYSFDYTLIQRALCLTGRLLRLGIAKDDNRPSERLERRPDLHLCSFSVNTHSWKSNCFVKEEKKEPLH